MIKASEILASAQELNHTIIAHRRAIHHEPEVGPHLPKTCAYVKEQLRRLGYDPVEICDSGIVATVTGKDTGRCILLRADMDGLAVPEQADIPFRSENGAMHACGHDMHTAMLLGTAALLKKYQDQLNGTVKLVFQPDEEGFTGAKAMLKAGVLLDPAPQAGLALHVHSGTPSGLLLCGRGTFMAGCTLFRIHIHGKGCHGAMPETGIDPINIAAHIYTALQSIVTREIPAKSPAVVTIGSFHAGQAPNIIPEEAVLEGSIRCFDRELTRKIISRLSTISQGIAASLGGSATVTELSSAPPLVNDPQLTDQMADLARAILGQERVYCMDEGGMGSEDFAAYTYELPCAYLLLGAGTAQENPAYGQPMHNEKVVFNEDILPLGAALETYCALQWLAQG